jgi:hypothetical protein
VDQINILIRSHYITAKKIDLISYLVYLWRNWKDNFFKKAEIDFKEDPRFHFYQSYLINSILVIAET